MNTIKIDYFESDWFKKDFLQKYDTAFVENLNIYLAINNSFRGYQSPYIDFDIKDLNSHFKTWIVDNIKKGFKGNYSIHMIYFHFNDSDDALLFKLTYL